MRTCCTALHCTKLQDFWVDIFNFFSRIFGVQIQPDPLLIIFGISEVLRTIRVAQQRLLSYGLITAKKLILMGWKGKEVPTKRRWLTELTDTLHLEKNRYTIKDNLKQFDKIWRPLISFLEEEQAS